MKRIISVAALALMACTAAPLGAGSKSRNQERLEALGRKVVAEVRTEATGAGQCRVAPFGAKPCGGPWRYLVYSTKATDEKKLLAMVEEYNALEKKINREEGRASDCAMVMPPKVELAGGECRARDRREQIR